MNDLQSKKDQIFNKLKTSLASKLGVEENDITLESTLKGDLGVDFLDEIELILDAEKDFNVSIPDEVAKCLLVISPDVYSAVTLTTPVIVYFIPIVGLMIEVHNLLALSEDPHRLLYLLYCEGWRVLNQF